jgi:phospholipid/cholesterol/gamma-HCH transport system substrate-binding protein
MTDSYKNIAIGVVVSLALALVLWVLLFLHPHFGDEGTKVQVRFTNIEKIAKGSRVTYAGTAVGQVLDIEPLTLSERLRSSEKEPFYTYKVTVGIDSHVALYNCDEFSLSTSGLMGERFVSITPRRPSPNSRLIVSGDTVNAIDHASMADTFAEIASVAAKTEDTVEQLASVLKENREEFHQTLASIKETSQSLNRLLLQTADANIIETVKRTIESAETTLKGVQDAKIIERLATTASNLETISHTLNQPEKFTKIINNLASSSEALNGAWPRVEGAIDDIQAASQAFVKLGQKSESIANAITTKEGSLGKLVYGNDFYFKTVSIMNKLDTMMNDVNHYGVLFHLDKGWQRQERARISQLNELKDPTEFKKYINDEMSKIQTSLSRLELAHEKSQDIINKSDKEEFTQTFSTLLAQLDALQGSLKNYSSIAADQEALAEEK